MARSARKIKPDLDRHTCTTSTVLTSRATRTVHNFVYAIHQTKNVGAVPGVSGYVDSGWFFDLQAASGRRLTVASHSLAVCRVSPPTTHTRHAGSLSACQMDPQRHTLVARLATRLDTHLATHVPRRRRMLYTTPDLGQSPWRPRASPAGARHGAMAAACTPFRPQVLGTALRPCRPPSCARAHSCARAGRSSRRSSSLPWHAWRHRVRAC